MAYLRWTSSYVPGYLPSDSDKLEQLVARYKFPYLKFSLAHNPFTKEYFINAKGSRHNFTTLVDITAKDTDINDIDEMSVRRSIEILVAKWAKKLIQDEGDARAMKAIEEQPQPQGSGVDVASLVHKDIEARVAYGLEHYGERLTSHNGRDALADAYQEALDLVLYLRQAIHERDGE